MTDYSGMTFNERLSAAGVERAWEEAVKSEDRTRLAEIMKSVGLETQASVIIEAEIGRWLYNKPKEIRYREMMKGRNEIHHD